MAQDRILVVDDEPLVALDLKERLDLLGYSVPEIVEYGEDVAAAVAKHRPDVVLMDIRLGGAVDGIDAAFHVKAEFEVPVIYLTAYSDAETLKRAARTRPDAFLLKPFDDRELAANIELALARAKSGAESATNAHAIEKRFLESSAAEANEMLASFLPGPDAAGPGYTVGGFLEPCLSGSGDFYDVFPLGPDGAAFYGIDVMGHGVVAALMAFTLRESLPGIARAGFADASGPAEVLRSLYETYSRKSDIKSSFFTITIGNLDTATGDYKVARGGHTPALRLSAAGGWKIHITKGAAVGVMPEAEVEEARGRLGKGDRLIVASDGLLDAFGDDTPDGAIRNLAAFCDERRGKSLGELMEALRARALSRRSDYFAPDDISVLAIERKRD